MHADALDLINLLINDTEKSVSQRIVMRAAFDAAGLSEACAACSHRLDNDVAGTGQDGGDGDGAETGGKGGAGGGEVDLLGDPFDAFAASIAQQEDNESKSNGLGAVSVEC